MNARTYAKALQKAVADKETSQHERYLENFFQLLRDRGHEKLLPAIVRQLDKLGSQRSHAKLLVARDTDRSQHEADIARELEHMGLEADELVVETRDELIGGYTIETPELLLDKSHKRALLGLYRQLAG